MVSRLGSLFIEPFKNVLGRIIEFIPALVGAVLILVVGFVIANLLKRLTEKVLVISKLDTMSEKMGVSDFTYKIGFGRSLAVIIGFLVYWLIFLVFILSAAELMKFTVVSELLNHFILFIPRLIAAIFVLVVGIIVGNFLDNLVLKVSQANKIESSGKLGKITKAVVIIFASIISLEQLKIGTLIVSDTLRIVLASFAIAVGIAFGLGGKDTAAELLKGLFKKDETK